jgi:putative transposase
MPVNHKRALRMMRKDNLLALRRRRFVVTTNSNHKFEVYLNLARRMRLSGTDQLWVADITYIRSKAEFVYLAVILDAFSRKVVGWALDRTLANRLTIAALEQAIAQRRPRPGLVHHSDRGLQYARGEYVAVLEKFGMVPSMSRPANPYDNASCESFIKTLKREEIYANKYDNLPIRISRTLTSLTSRSRDRGWREWQSTIASTLTRLKPTGIVASARNSLKQRWEN